MNMKIGQTQAQTNQVGRTESSIELKKGDILSATIKERLPQNEAIIQLRGKDVQVKFEGSVPSSDKATIQVTGSNGEIPQVKAVVQGQQGQSSDSDISKVLRNLGASATSELKTAAKYVLDQGVPLSKDVVADLKAFLEKNPGVMNQKLETIKVIASKGLEITSLHLTSVHEALHGKPLSYQLSDLAKRVGLDRPLKQLERAAAAQDRLVQALEQAEVGGNSELNSLIELVEQAKDMLQNQANLEKVIQQISVNLVNHPQLDQQQIEKMSKLGNQALHLKQVGLEHVGRNKLMEELQHIEHDLIDGVKDQSKDQSFIQEKTLGEESDNYQLNDELLAGLKLDSKDIVITHVTDRMAQATAQFRELKREATRNLDAMIKFTEDTKTNVYPQIKQVLQSTIDVIDKAILKSDFIMFADMATEKQLMSISMDLATAKKHVADGRNDQAATLLREIKTKLEELNWRPADVRVRHILTHEQLIRESDSTKQEFMHYVDQVSGAERSERSARNTFELIRSLGLNYDSEVAQSLVSSQEGRNEEHVQQNMKAVMMKLLNTDGDFPLEPRGDQQVKEILQNITGQQLLNKSETGSPFQTMFFSLPLMMGANMETVKLYVNSKKDGEKIDWENCSLYFLMDTKKLGETGIFLTANNRNLSITLKNDHPIFKEKMEAIADRCKDNLKEIGYNISAINFTKLSNEKEIPNQNTISQPSTPIARTTAKGFDFSV